MRTLLFILFVVATGCSSPDSKDHAAQAGPDLVDLPANAIREPFADEPGMEKIKVLYPEGKLAAEGILVDGKREGAWVEYHPNGLVKSITPYVNGKKEGSSVEINETGGFTRRTSYHRNLKHGDYKEFNTMTIKEERVYKNDKLDGVVKIYYPDGRVMEEGAYVEGIRNGISRWYNLEGKMTIEYEYKNGELIKK